MSQKTIIPVILIALTALSVTFFYQDSNKRYLSEYQKWKQQFNIQYQSTFEDLYRQKLFFKKKQLIDIHNKNQSKTYTKGLNHFSALTLQQFRQTYLTYQKDQITRKYQQDILVENIGIPTATIDWRTQGAVGPIKDQGKCGSCWAFSTVAGLQATSKIFAGDLKSFSEQQLVDCDHDNKGCVGGQMRRAINYVKNYGSVYEEEYPYKGQKGHCLKKNGHFFVSGYTDVTGCANLANALTSRPLVVGLDANNWDDYKSGVFNNCVNDKDVFNHGVLLIGMTNDYWLIKNSFGTKWGENGFMRLAMGNMCNICDDGIMIQK